MSLVTLTILVLAVAYGVHADHAVTFVNNCPFDLTPMWKDNDDGASNHKGQTIGPGQSYTTVLPEIWNSGRMFVQDPLNTCKLPDGADCTLVECSFGPGTPRYWQCNISVVSGYSVPLGYKFVGGNESSCTGFECLNASCPMSQAYRVEGCQGCINQCNTDNVGLQVTLCPAGSTIPNFPRSPSAPAAPSKPASSAPNPTSPKATSSKPVQSKPTSTAPVASISVTLPVAVNPAAAPTTLAAAPTKSTGRCSRQRRRSRRAHRRAMLARAEAHS